jgi:hypothetical protein
MLSDENKKTSFQRIVLTVLLALCLTAMNFTPGMAASRQSGSYCDTEYVVQWGDSLSKIGLRYGVSWPDIAANNGIGYPYWVYTGQHLCISGAAAGTTGSSGVSVTVTGSVEDKNVSITTSNLPKKEIFDVLIGTCANTGVNGNIVGKIKTDGVAGSYSGKFKIPQSLDGTSCLAVRISSRISSRTAYATFINGYGSSNVQVQAIDFSVKSVVKNKTVKIKVSNAIKGKKYKVYITMGGQGASDGVYIDTFIPGSSSSFFKTYAIPSKYKGATKMDLRIQGVNTSGVVYHTFWNKTQ